MKYQVFISYRRAGGESTAQIIHDRLQALGYNVFYDIESLKNGRFDNTLLEKIEECKDVVIILSKGALDRCVNEGDWVRKEIAHALACKKNVVPVMTRDFTFPAELPEDISALPRMNGIEFDSMQYLDARIEHLSSMLSSTPDGSVHTHTASSSVLPLIKRAYMYLEDGEWTSADEYCERILDQDPENASAYVGKLMAELHVCKQEDLKNQAKPFDNNKNYVKAVRFADDELKATLQGYIEYIKIRNENARLQDIYNRAKGMMSKAKTETAYIEAAKLFAAISTYQDAASLADECRSLAEASRKDAVLATAKSYYAKGSISDCQQAIKLLESISGWRDADKQIAACELKIERINAKAEADRKERERRAEAERLERERRQEADRQRAEKRAKQNKKIAIVTVAAICIFIAFIIVLNVAIIPNVKYNDAMDLYNSGKYEEAGKSFFALDDYKDSDEMYKKSFQALLGDPEALVVRTSADYPFDVDNSGVITVTDKNQIGSSVVIPRVVNAKFVTYIGTSAFSNCSNLENVIIPESVTGIGAYAFSDCSKIENISIPESVTSIGGYAFSGCSSLASVAIPNGVTSIMLCTFANCLSLTSITIPESVTSIGAEAFANCSSLTSITIPNGVTSIGAEAFANCSSLESVIIPDSITKIENGAFSGCPLLVGITIPKSVMEAGSTAISDFSGLSSVIIPDGVTSIDEAAFADFSCLERIYIPDSVTSIGSGAFRDCANLKEIIIPNSVTSIGSEAFAGCVGLESITVPFVGERADGAGSTHFGHIFGASNNQANESFAPASLKNVVISGGTSISDRAFSGFSNIKSITISDSITSIGEYAFYECTGLTSVDLGSGVTSIGYCQFSLCESLKSITIPDGVTSIENSAFSNCYDLESITIPNSVKHIRPRALYYCTSLTSIYFDGTKSEWSLISKGTDWSYNTGNYTIYCTDGEISK